MRARLYLLLAAVLWTLLLVACEGSEPKLDSTATPTIIAATATATRIFPPSPTPTATTAPASTPTPTTASAPTPTPTTASVPTPTPTMSFDTTYFALLSLDSEEAGFFPVQKGKSRDQVLESLGSPFLKLENNLPTGPFSGPQQGLESVIGFGSSYEEWLYRDSGSDYFIWFATTAEQPKDQWVVVAAAKFPTDAVF